MEQPGERRKTQEIYDRVDKLLSAGGYEKPDGSADEIQNTPDTTSTRMEGA